MKRPYQITAALLFLFSVFVVYGSLRLRYYTPLGPGPGFFPFWLSLVLGVLSVVMFYQATFKKSEPMPDDFFDSKLGYLRGLAICVAWIWATAFLKPLGYRITMMVFFPFLLLTLGRVRWYTITLFTVIGSVGAYWIFTRVLRVVLPLGPFDGFFRPIDDFLESFISMFG